MKVILFTNGKISSTNDYKLRQLDAVFKSSKISLETIDTQTKLGGDMASSYGIMDYPSLVIVREDGGVQGFWQADLPSRDQLSQAIGYL
ncbi:MAG: hypothetical protein NT111_02275 [Patescibacteria group bacterium]|nr:hypothetical protein [Patescibacteria group bacterium]